MIKNPEILKFKNFLHQLGVVLTFERLSGGFEKLEGASPINYISGSIPLKNEWFAINQAWKNHLTRKAS